MRKRRTCPDGHVQPSTRATLLVRLFFCIFFRANSLLTLVTGANTTVRGQTLPTCN